jgi:hypothetical protein
LDRFVKETMPWFRHLLEALRTPPRIPKRPGRPSRKTAGQWGHLLAALRTPPRVPKRRNLSIDCEAHIKAASDAGGSNTDSSDSGICMALPANFQIPPKGLRVITECHGGHVTVDHVTMVGYTRR